MQTNSNQFDALNDYIDKNIKTIGYLIVSDDVNSLLKELTGYEFGEDNDIGHEANKYRNIRIFVDPYLEPSQLLFTFKNNGMHFEIPEIDLPF
jgi:hypothetical protein